MNDQKPKGLAGQIETEVEPGATLDMELTPFLETLLERISRGIPLPPISLSTPEDAQRAAEALAAHQEMLSANRDEIRSLRQAYLTVDVKRRQS